MARFRATMQGQRGSASRLGSAKTGITARVNGWNVGVSVMAEALDDKDRVWLTATGGSNGATLERCLGYIELRDSVPVFVAYADVMRYGSKKAKAS